MEVAQARVQWRVLNLQVLIQENYTHTDNIVKFIGSLRTANQAAGLFIYLSVVI